MSTQEISRTHPTSVASVVSMSDIIIAIHKEFVPYVVAALKDTRSVAITNARDPNITDDQRKFYTDLCVEAANTIVRIQEALDGSCS